jgi:chromosome segregation ATPase
LAETQPGGFFFTNRAHSAFLKASTMSKKQTAQSTTPSLGDQIQALEAAIESRAAQIQDSTALIKRLTAEHLKGSSFARGHGWIFSGREALPGELSLARAGLDALHSTQRDAQRELEALRAIRDSASDLREVESDLALLRADLARVNASAAEMRGRAAGFAANLLAAQDALGVAFDAESTAALEGDAQALTAAGDAVAQAQQVVDRITRTGALAAARLVEIADSHRAVQEAIDMLTYRLAAAKLACAKREIAELLPALVALCCDAYEAGYLTQGGRWGGEAQVPDLLALVKAARGGSPVDIRRRDPSPRFTTPGVGKLAHGTARRRAA